MGARQAHQDEEACGRPNAEFGSGRLLASREDASSGIELARRSHGSHAALLRSSVWLDIRRDRRPARRALGPQPIEGPRQRDASPEPAEKDREHMDRARRVTDQVDCPDDPDCSGKDGP